MIKSYITDVQYKKHLAKEINIQRYFLVDEVHEDAYVPYAWKAIFALWVFKCIMQEIWFVIKNYIWTILDDKTYKKAQFWLVIKQINSFVMSKEHGIQQDISSLFIEQT